MAANKTYSWLPVSVARQGAVRAKAPVMARAILLVLVAGISAHPAFAAEVFTRASPARAAAALPGTGKPAPVAHRLVPVDFGRENPSREARQMAEWIVDSGDSQGMPFVIVDKLDAKVFVFDADGRLSGASSALLGLGRGDDSVPDIGTRKLSSILPEERTTPAGRYVASLGHNLHGGEILWVDYDAAFSLHPVITSNAKERRAQRLSTPTALDNRISSGCVNVPAKFYKGVVSPAFKHSSGVVYVMPETRSLQASFPSFFTEHVATNAAQPGHD